MQDDIWDAPKRDRGRWMGDTDVSGRVIDDVFADQFLIEDTLTRLIGPLPIKEHVNGIPGYSSYWFTELEHYYLHTGRKEFVASMHDRIVGLLQFMDQDFDAQNNFINHTHQWLYVDWALELNGDTPSTRATTTIEYVRAYRAGAHLLQELGDTQNASHFAQRADELAHSSQASQFANGSFGPRWQTNAMAVISGVATPDQYASIWQNVLANVGKPTWRPDVVSPYYGSYVLDAIARIDHRDAALAWIREYWGGMIDEGATSFWEAYDPAWPKPRPPAESPPVRAIAPPHPELSPQATPAAAHSPPGTTPRTPCTLCIPRTGSAPAGPPSGSPGRPCCTCRNRCTPVCRAGSSRD
jgi:hypothetical protein